jgi:hypothetical protein
MRGTTQTLKPSLTINNIKYLAERDRAKC